MARPYGTHSTLRKERKQRTRERLARAAVDVLCERGLAGATIEDIAVRAEVSRQTFYFHFESKEQLLLEIMRVEEDRMMARYEQLAEIAVPTAESCARWADGVLGLTRENRAAILLLMRTVPFEADQGGNISQFYDTVIAMLAARLPAFAAATRDGDPVQRARALLLFFQLEMMQRHALVETGFDTRSICLAWGAQWAAFVNERNG